MIYTSFTIMFNITHYHVHYPSASYSLSLTIMFTINYHHVQYFSPSCSLSLTTMFTVAHHHVHHYSPSCSLSLTIMFIISHHHVHHHFHRQGWVAVVPFRQLEREGDHFLCHSQSHDKAPVCKRPSLFFFWVGGRKGSGPIIVSSYVLWVLWPLASHNPLKDVNQVDEKRFWACRTQHLLTKFQVNRSKNEEMALICWLLEREIRLIGRNIKKKISFFLWRKTNRNSSEKKNTQNSGRNSKKNVFTHLLALLVTVVRQGN